VSSGGGTIDTTFGMETVPFGARGLRELGGRGEELLAMTPLIGSSGLWPPTMTMNAAVDATNKTLRDRCEPNASTA
jgi:hypothetical protein